MTNINSSSVRHLVLATDGTCLANLGQGGWAADTVAKDAA